MDKETQQNLIDILNVHWTRYMMAVHPGEPIEEVSARKHAFLGGIVIGMHLGKDSIDPKIWIETALKIQGDMRETANKQHAQDPFKGLINALQKAFEDSKKQPQQKPNKLDLGKDRGQSFGA